VKLRSIMRRLRSGAGFGLVELLIAMTLLSIGIFALLAAYTSSTTALMRASRVATAGTVANKQMELYRGLLYDDIRLDSASIPTTGEYVADSAYTGGAQITTPACSGSPLPDECDASRAATGPDGRSYQVDVYMYTDTLPGGRTVKEVTVVVRDNADSSRVLARRESTFDLYTGCASGSC
jgi:type II secretory pathway pseudopilin PulG